MAQKRMFDKAVIDTDKFMDLPVSAKALYFLLGMEADDEGFVSYKKVIRIHGGNEDDIKILAAKNLVILFKTGVAVITDWRKNNWLDSRRIKNTEYITEKELLAVTKQNQYMLSDGAASAQPEEYRGEQNSTEESSREKIKKTLKKKILNEEPYANEVQCGTIPNTEKPLTPGQVAKIFFDVGDKRSGQVFGTALLFFMTKGLPEDIVKRELHKFRAYWTEPNGRGTKARWEMQKTFELKRRMATWFCNMTERQGQKRGSKFSNIPSL